jgi:hypothetical protein
MSDKKIGGRIDRTRKAWKVPAVDRFNAGSAETGPGANGETNSLS